MNQSIQSKQRSDCQIQFPLLISSALTVVAAAITILKDLHPYAASEWSDWRSFGVPVVDWGVFLVCAGMAGKNLISWHGSGETPLFGA